MNERQAPAARDQEASPFAEILAGFWQAHGSVLAAAFVDAEGECIDYYSSLDPFEAKVAGAHMVSTLSVLAEPCSRLGLGDVHLWTVEAAERDLVVARVTDEYSVVLVLHAHGLTARLLEALEGLVEAFGAEAGVELAPQGIEVEVDSDADGRVVPRALTLGGQRVPVVRVLARWSEPGALSSQPRRCYRVRLSVEGASIGQPRELTIIHDPHLGSFRLRGRHSKAP